jgi:hypothetical protein
LANTGYFENCPDWATDIGIGADGAVYITGTDAVCGGYGIYRGTAALGTKYTERP